MYRLSSPYRDPCTRALVCVLSFVSLIVILQTIDCLVFLYMRFSRQKYWSGLLFPSPGDLPNPGIESGSPALWADALPSEPPGKPNLVYEDMIRKELSTILP